MSVKRMGYGNLKPVKAQPVATAAGRKIAAESAANNVQVAHGLPNHDFTGGITRDLKTASHSGPASTGGTVPIQEGPASAKPPRRAK